MYDSIYIWFSKVSSNFSHLQTNPTVGFTKDEHLLYPYVFYHMESSDKYATAQYEFPIFIPLEKR